MTAQWTLYSPAVQVFLSVTVFHAKTLIGPVYAHVPMIYLDTLVLFRLVSSFSTTFTNVGECSRELFGLSLAFWPSWIYYSMLYFSSETLSFNTQIEDDFQSM